MIRKIILSIVASSVGLYLADYFLQNLCFLNSVAETCPEKPEASILVFAIAGAILGILNIFVKPLLKLISMPITFLTAGLFMFVVNGVVFGLLVWLINTLDLEGLSVMITSDPAWITYLYAAIVLGLFNIATHWLIKSR